VTEGEKRRSRTPFVGGKPGDNDQGWAFGKRPAEKRGSRKRNAVRQGGTNGATELGGTRGRLTVRLRTMGSNRSIWKERTVTGKVVGDLPTRVH